MKKTIRLTESDIRRMVMEAMNELDWKTYANAAKKSKERGDRERNYRFRDKTCQQFNKDLGVDTREGDGTNRGWTYSGSPFSDKGMPISNLTYHNGVDNYGTSKYSDQGLYDFDNITGHRFFRSEEPIVDPQDDTVMSIPKDLDDRRRKGDQELMDYLSGRYHYKKGEGWTNKDEYDYNDYPWDLDEAITRAIRKYLK